MRKPFKFLGVLITVALLLYGMAPTIGAGLLTSGLLAKAATAYNGNLSGFGAPMAWTPVLKGQTEDPGVTYTTQNGQFWAVGPMVYFTFQIVTSGTTTKTTTADNFAVSLPTVSATITGDQKIVSCYVQNATPVTNGLIGVIGSNTSQITFLGQGTTTTTIFNEMTWATTNPGIGVLSHVITAECSGWYQAAAPF